MVRASGGGGLPALVAVAAAVAAVYALFWPAVTGDMRTFLEPWLDVILANGRIGAFADPFSNYTPTYLYLLSAFSLLVGALSKYSVIKALAVFGALLLGIATLRLVRAAGDGEARPALALWVMLLPSVIVNAPGMGQCDAFWAAACVMAVAAAIERRPVAMLVWFGIGIAFKAQAIFLAPFILQRLLAQRTPVPLWPLPGLVYALAMLPAILAGWPPLHAATVYLRQAEWGEDFIGNAANPWSFVHHFARADGAGWLWLGHLAALVAVGLYLFATRRARDPDPRCVVALALLATMIVPFLLPKMHERFFFIADILAFVLAYVWRDRRSILVLLLVQGASMLATWGLFLHRPAMPMAGALLMAGAILLTIGILRGKPVEPAVRRRRGPAPARHIRSPSRSAHRASGGR